MSDFSFNDLIDRRAVDIHTSRIVRHDWRALQAWRHSRARFDHFVSLQKTGSNTPYRGAQLIFQFVPMGSTLGMFVGAHEILEEWLYPDDQREPRLTDVTSDYNKGDGTHLRYDLKHFEPFEDLVGRVIIDWGAGTRAWSQWPARRPKPIVELRAKPEDEPFPGFSAFTSTIEEVALLPSSWQGALSNVNGVYLLVCPSTGEQYVGSAYGEGGFMARWLEYAANGHGGNRLLIGRARSNFAVSILEVASPDMSASDIIHRESAWKSKLGTRAHGLNAN